MNKILLTLFFFFLSIPSHATKVHGARLDKRKKNIVLDISYSGGCKEHRFFLDVDYCARTKPTTCQVSLREEIGDRPGETDDCESLIETSASINLRKSGFHTAYYSKARFHIHLQTEAASESVQVRLPRMKSKQR